jgi:hypothetical protein
MNAQAKSLRAGPDARGHFGRLFDADIWAAHGLPVTLYDPRSPGADAYTRLAAEFLRRHRARLRQEASA